MTTVPYGCFMMLKPVRSKKGYWIVGGIVGDDDATMYTVRVSKPKDIALAMEKARMKILLDHPGIRDMSSATEMRKLGQ